MSGRARSFGVVVLVVALVATVCPCAQLFTGRAAAVAWSAAPRAGGHDCCAPADRGGTPADAPAPEHVVCCHANLAGEPVGAGMAAHAASAAVASAPTLLTAVLLPADPLRIAPPLDASPPGRAVGLFLLTRAILV